MVQVTVVYSPAPREVREWHVSLPAGSTVLQAMHASGLAVELSGVDPASVAAGIWGRKVPLGQLVRNNDRIEVYRPLRVDPKVARRERFREQGVRAAGLFARKG
jgi:putative ubiquitin-RnfH superfamily antitoxin RatB of RatAB toxin-antitoxin module